MGDVEQIQKTEEQEPGVSRRSFIKGVVATGASVSASNYVLRGGQGVALAQAPGAVERLVTLTVNGQQRRVDVALGIIDPAAFLNGRIDLTEG